MTDTSKCYSIIRGRAMRVTKLDACGSKVLGPASQAVSDGFIQVAFTTNVDTGTQINVTNAAGATCILDTPAPKFLNYGVEVQFCGVNPDLYRLMTSQKMVTDSTGLGTGFRVNSKVDLSEQGFGLELWSSVPSSVCTDGQQSYGYTLVPFLQGGYIGDFTIANDAVNFTLSGATTKDGNNWGVGPYDVTLDDTATPSPLLEALDPYDHLHVDLVQVAPPTSFCGAQALGVPATGADAGTPATLTPTNSYAPADFADIGSLTASPNTAWTAGQYVLLGDGTKAHWDGSAWVAGAA